ncbi:MAG: META domain-containing protein [Burkholderiaceae bacterium]|nr:META domain-containing protein [Burkholderiaceae bacterium]
MIMWTRLACLMFCIFFLVIFAGCLAPVSPARVPPGQSWRLTSYNVGNKMIKPESNTTITLTFGPNGLMSGSTVCNEYHATYQFEGEIISLGNIGSTDTNCTTPIKMTEMEKVYFQLLNNTTRFSLDKNTLTLSYFDEKKLLVFERQPF